MTLSEKLELGDEDLMGVLIACGINCASCQSNEKMDGLVGWICKRENSFTSLPEGSVCMKWRQRKGE